MYLVFNNMSDGTMLVKILLLCPKCTEHSWRHQLKCSGEYIFQTTRLLKKIRSSDSTAWISFNGKRYWMLNLTFFNRFFSDDWCLLETWGKSWRSTSQGEYSVTLLIIILLISRAFLSPFISFDYFLFSYIKLPRWVNGGGGANCLLIFIDRCS